MQHFTNLLITLRVKYLYNKIKSPHFRYKFWQKHKELIIILGGCAVLILFLQLTDKSSLEDKIDKQGDIIEAQEQKSEINDKIIDEKDKLLEDAKTDIERLEEQKEKKDEEIQRLEVELQAKKDREESIRLASITTVSTTPSVAPVSSNTIHQPVVATYDAIGGVSTGYWDGNGGVYGQCVYGVDAAVGIPNGTGNARDLAYTLPAYGYTIGKPKINSIAVFQPGVYGANGTYGHVGYTTAIHNDGTVTIREMNAAGGIGVYTQRRLPAEGIQFLSL